MIQIYYGDGKGKTTAGYGLCLRMAGQGKRAAVFRFLKPEGGESKVFIKTGLVKVFSFETEHNFYEFCEEAEKKLIKEEIKKEFDLFCDIISRGYYDIILLDEILDVLSLGLVDETELIDILRQARNTEIVLTGRKAPKNISEIADYITHFVKEAHPYDKGIKARKGIEF